MAKPKPIQFNFEIPAEKLWKLRIPVDEMLISDLEHNLDIAYLEKEGTDDWNLTLRELIQDLNKYLSHLQKIKDADMQYPIEVYFFDGSWKILDGVHRFCKAVIEKQKTIKVRKVTDEMISHQLLESKANERL